MCPECKRSWTYDTRYSTQINVKICEPCGLSIDESTHDQVGPGAKKLSKPLNLTRHF